MMSEEHSGVLECSDETLSYRSGVGDWTIPISAIRVIAEYTNADGPWIDDYFLVFLTAAAGGWHEASFYAKGREAALCALGRMVGAPLECGLCGSTEYHTRILWPADIKGQTLMDVTHLERRSIWSRFADCGSADVVLSDVVRQALTR